MNFKISSILFHFFFQKQKALQAQRKSLLPPKAPTIKRQPNMINLLLYYPVARRNFFLITFNWLANALVYNGLSFYSADLGVSSHLGKCINAIECKELLLISIVL